MDKIPIPEYDEVPLERIAMGLTGLRILFVNVFAVESSLGGHTAGHVSLFREADRVLFVGDAFCTTDNQSLLAVAQQRPELHGPPAYYTPDWDQAKASVQKLAALRPSLLAPGHGLPMEGADVEAALDRLAADFDPIARPDNAVRT